MDKIKTQYILKNLLSFLDKRNQLKIFRENKYIQNLLDINIFYYKRLSERFFIGEENGKGKEFSGYNDALLFEGEYSNGKRNRKGKEYYSNGKIKFEGE